MGKGRKPLPEGVKRLTGNPGKRPVKREPKPKGKALRKPKWLQADGAEMWSRVVGAWQGTDVLTGADQAAIEAYCAAYGRFVIAQANVMENGITIADSMGNIKKNPAVTVLNEATAQMRAFGAEMGLTPSARARLSTGPANTADEFEIFKANAS